MDFGVAELPIIIEGVHVWHETFDRRQTPIMLYYDTRNPLFVNAIHFPWLDSQAVLNKWHETITSYHVAGDFCFRILCNSWYA
ncbi:MAG: hypothetical protein ACLVCH_15915 [Roseburia inulinivorans]